MNGRTSTTIRKAILAAVSVGGCCMSLLALGSCRSATQIQVHFTTDMACGDFHGSTVTVGRLEDLESRASATSSVACDASGDLGTLVIVPSGDPGEEVAFRVVAGLGRDVESCQPPGYGKGCIVARRALRFTPHATLLLEVPLRAACEGVPCSATTTCVAARCVDAVIRDLASCVDGCTEPTGIDTDGGPPAESEAGSDAAVLDVDAGIEIAIDVIVAGERHPGWVYV